MRTIAVSNQKGGSCKTTTVVNLAAALAEKGKRVLVIDLDPQTSATLWLGSDVTDSKLPYVFLQKVALQDLAKATPIPNLDLVAGSPDLVSIERRLARDVSAEVVLLSAMERLPAKWDFVLIDCPPSMGLLSVSALVACEEVLVTVEARIMALVGMGGLFKTVAAVKERLNPELRLAGILACRVDLRTRLSQQVVDTLRERFHKGVLKSVIRENIRLAEAPAVAKPITIYDPSCAGAEDYRALADELIQQRRRSSSS